MEYGPYPEYPQLYPPFEHGVSVLDMLFSLGEKAPSYIWKDTSQNTLDNTQSTNQNT